MDRRKFSLSLVGAAAAAGLAACGGGGGGLPASLPEAPETPTTPATPTTPVGAPELATPTSLPAATVFLQRITSSDGDAPVAPGNANFWDLDLEFRVRDGFDDQFDGALDLEVEVGGTVQSFPDDQTYPELTAFGPELTEADGVRSVSFTNEAPFVFDGTITAALHLLPDARLQQRLDLTAAAGHGVALQWVGNDRCGSYIFNDEPYLIQVVVRDESGALLATLYRRDRSGTTGTWGTASLTAFAGQVVVLCFEQRSTYQMTTTIDRVSVRDSTTGTEFVTNGDFEAGATGWTVPAPRVAQNVTAGVRTLHGLQVHRSFFSQPNASWARMTDEFVNPGATDISAVVRYVTNLGSDGDGVIYPAPGSPDKALTSWDAWGTDRDLGWVFGSTQKTTYASTTSMSAEDGNDMATVEFHVTVPAGGRVSLVNFLVMTGVCTGKTATAITARATEVDVAAADIASNFRTDFAYQRGMTQAQLDSLRNF